MGWIEKQKNVIDFTLSSLLRRKGKNTALVVVYAFVVFTVSAVVFFTRSIQEEASVVLRNAPEMMVQRLIAGRHDLIPLSYIDTIRRIRGVQDVQARLWGYYFDPTNGANYTLIADAAFEHGDGNIVIGRGVERNLPSTVGGTMPFKAYDGSYVFLKMKEVLPSESELVSADLIMLSVNDFRRLFGVPGNQATDLVLSVRNSRELSTIAAKILTLLPDTRPITREEILRTYDAVFSWRGGMMIVILSGAVMAFVILAWDKATGLSAEEKREIGVLKAIGWETSDILLMKFWEGAVISLSSFLLGVSAAYLHVYLASSVLFEPALKGWSVLYPQFRLTPFVSAYQGATLFFLAVVPYTVATIVPSWRAATVDPDAVMRS